jgi:type II secretory pathway pseudopilin PulG
MSQRGFAYLFVLAAICVLSIGLVAATDVWQATAHRQRVEQLEWVGAQYAQAIGSYVESTPGQGKTYPARIEDLLEDRRFATPRRHLREAYRNPTTRDGQWEIIFGADLRMHGVRAVVPWQPEQRAREWTYQQRATGL